MKNEIKLKIKIKINKLIDQRDAAVDVMDACDINCESDSIKYKLAVGKIKETFVICFL